MIVAELRSVLECVAGHGDDDDRSQAELCLRASNRGPSFLEASVWFCVGFLQKHVSLESLAPDHRACLAGLQQICMRLVSLEQARDKARRRGRRERQQRQQQERLLQPQEEQPERMVDAQPLVSRPRSPFDVQREWLESKEAASTSPTRLPPSSANIPKKAKPARNDGARVKPQARGADVDEPFVGDAARPAVSADDSSAGSRAQLSLGPHQLTILAACVQALEDKGIGAGASMWKNVALTFRGSAASKGPYGSPLPKTVGGGEGGGGGGVVSTPGGAPPMAGSTAPSTGLSAHARRRKMTLSDLKDEDEAERDGSGGSSDASKGGRAMRGGEGSSGGGGGGSGSDSRKRLYIEYSDDGMAVGRKIAAAVQSSQPWIEAWATQGFENSVRIFKNDDASPDDEEGGDSLRPVIDQLRGGDSADAKRLGPDAAAASSLMKEHCLRVLQALLTAEPTLQDQLNRMGVTAVMLNTLAAPSTEKGYNAALELGIALLDDGNRRVQSTVYATLASAGSNATLSSFANTLNGVVHKIEMCVFTNELMHRPDFCTTSPSPLEEDKSFSSDCLRIHFTSSLLSPRLYRYFTEQKQNDWYTSILAPHLSIAAAARPLRLDEDANRQRGGRRGRGSSSALCFAVTAAQAEARATAAAASATAAVAAAAGGAPHNDSTPALVASAAATSLHAQEEAPSSVNTVVAVQVLQLMECMAEAQYQVMKDFMRVQGMMRTQVNMVLYLVNNLLVLERSVSPLTISLTCQLYQTLIELVQGPCSANQRLLIGTNLCDVAVRFMHGVYPQCEAADVVELKILCLRLLISMVEGVQTDFIPRRIASSLDYAKLIREIDDAYAHSGGEATRPHPNPSLEHKAMNELQRGYRQVCATAANGMTRTRTHRVGKILPAPISCELPILD